MTLQGKSCLKCISHKCGKEYPIPVFEFNCTCGNLLDVKYNDTPSQNLKEVFYQRRNPQGSIFNESGVWRFRELLNFCEIDTEDLTQCSQHLVSLDGAEGRQSKPYHMSKVAKFVGIENEKLMLQPEGYNPSGSFKDNGMSTAVTHAKLVGAKKSFVHQLVILQLQQVCLPQMKIWNVMYIFQKAKSLQVNLVKHINLVHN